MQASKRYIFELKPYDRIVWVFAILLYIVAAFFPVYMPKHSSIPLSSIGLIITNHAAILIVLPLAMASVAIVILKHRYLRYIVPGLVASTAASIWINNTTNTSAATPEPWTTLFLIINLGLIPSICYFYLLRGTMRIGRRWRKEERESLQRLALDTNNGSSLPIDTERANYKRGAKFAAASQLIAIPLWYAGARWVGNAAIFVLFTTIFTISLYRKSAGKYVIDRKGAWIITASTVAGIFAAFFVTYSIDMALMAQNVWHISIGSVMTNHLYWGWELHALADMQFIWEQGYVKDLAGGLFFAALALHLTVLPALLPKPPATTRYIRTKSGRYFELMTEEGVKYTFYVMFICWLASFVLWPLFDLIVILTAVLLLIAPRYTRLVPKNKVARYRILAVVFIVVGLLSASRYWWLRG